MTGGHKGRKEVVRKLRIIGGLALRMRSGIYLRMREGRKS